MLDLYQALVPAISIITFLNLLSLKLALKDNVALTKIHNNKQSLELMAKHNEQQSAAKTMLKFLLLNFTPLEFFIVRRARYKIPFFLSVSIIMVASYFIKIPFAFTFVGSLSYFTYFLVTKRMLSSQQEQASREQSKIYRQQYLQVIMGIISIVLNVVVIGITYKNYKNSVLNTFITDACVDIALDNFIVRPIIVTLIGLPLSRSLAAVNYMKQCQKQIVLLEIYEEVGQKQVLSKIGKQLSPSKIPAKIPVDFQIEPVPVHNSKMIGIQKHVDMLRKIKRDKTLTPINDKLQRNMECELTLNSLFNSNKKQENQHAEDPLQDQKFKEKIQPQENLPMKKNVVKDNLIMINPSRQEQVENEQEIATEQALNGKLNSEPQRVGHREPMEASNREFADSNHSDQNDPVKISIHSSSQPTSRQQPLRICLNGQINLDLQQHFHEEQEVETDNYRKRRDLQTIDQNMNKYSVGVLEIKEQNHMQRRSDEIEEIDLNSPERRKRQVHVQLQKESELGVVKRKKKKFSHDQNQNRVIKFSTGEPYLEYLPHMLAKDANKGKKSQAISKKDIIMDSRATNSVKRPKKRLVGIQNNENAVPQFRIEEL